MTSDMKTPGTNTGPVLPDADYVVSSVLGIHGGGNRDILARECQKWSQALTFVCDGVTRAPWPFLDHWVWLPAIGESGLAGARYFLHMGIGRIWDVWASKWCPQQWEREKNTPRVSTVCGGRVAWSQLGALVAPACEAPSMPPGIVWTLTMHPDHARLLQDYEEKHGPGTGCFDVYAMRWTRRGKPSKTPMMHTLTPLPQYLIEPREV